MSHSTSVRGVVGAAVAMTGVGTLTAVSATISHYPLFGGQAVRYTLAALLLLLIARLTDKRRGAVPVRTTWRERGLVVALAATGLVGFNICIVLGTRYTSPATIGTVVGSVPVILAVLGPLLAGRRPAARIVGAAMIVTVGAGLATGLGGGSALGLLAALGALAGEVCFSLLAVPLLPRLGAIRVSAYSTATAVPMLLVAGLVMDGRGLLRMPTGAETAGLAYLSVVVTVGAFLLWYDALGRVPTEKAGLFAGLIPVSSVVTTVVLGMATPGLPEIAGAALVAAGVITGLRPARRRLVPAVTPG